jgi:hypothetical protein
MKGKFPRRSTYCRCDRAWVTIGMKCPICGRRQGDGHGKIHKKSNNELIKEFMVENDN